MSDLLFVLEGHEPVSCPDPIEWARWFEGADEARRVGFDRVGSSEVSTVFLGLDYNMFPSGPRQLFETMVFTESDNEVVRRYSTWDEAEVGHKMMVSTLRAVEEVP